jgi:N-acetylglucosaminyldiphosphoundecaprenol N-acetyl-beta-D-mannosaminyltransferase
VLDGANCPAPTNRLRARVVRAPIDVLSWDDAFARVEGWAQGRVSRAVFFCSVHSVMTSLVDADFAQAYERADLVAPDGFPVAWMLRQLGAPQQARIDAATFMWRALSLGAARGARVYFLGGSPATLAALCRRAAREFPLLQIAGAESPPFRPMTQDEDRAIVDRINGSGAELVFVGLGCPKQEKWIAAHRGVVQAPMLGVGAAFDFCSLRVRRAPEWMQAHSLEWLFRLTQEPRRLALRYLATNLPFVALAAAQWLGSRITGARPAASRGVQTSPPRF